MTSLLDIGPLTETVKVNGKEVTVHGVTPEGFFLVLEKFPAIAGMFASGAQRVVDMSMLQAEAPGSVAYAIALATTDRSEFQTAASWREAVDKAVKVALSLSAHYQMMLFDAALRLTFPDGVGPFMKGMDALIRSINKISGDLPEKVQDTTSSRRSRPAFEVDSPGLRLGKAARSASSARSARSGPEKMLVEEQTH